jgi:RES domain-containing protein
MKVFRLAKEKPGRYRADDLSGSGAALAGGRWNPRGVPVLYTCCHASTAVLEARVHASGLLPVANFYLVTLEVPDRAASSAYVPDLPDDWNALDHARPRLLTLRGSGWKPASGLRCGFRPLSARVTTT